MAAKSWGQKISIPRESIDKTVAIAKGEEEISNEGFYDANQWEFFHWTALHSDKNRKLFFHRINFEMLISSSFAAVTIDVYLRVQDLMKISLGAGTQEIPFVVLEELKTVARWNANLFCPIHPALKCVHHVDSVIQVFI